MVTREIKKRPVRGGIWGLLFGLGVALLLIAFNVIAFGTMPPYVVAVLGVVAGVLWGIYGPAKGSDEPPADAEVT